MSFKTQNTLNFTKNPKNSKIRENTFFFIQM